MESSGQPDSRAGGWVAGVDLASWFVAEAAGAYGGQVLADPQPGRGRAPIGINQSALLRGTPFNWLSLLPQRTGASRRPPLTTG